jgi:Cap4, dsDNA endonuclease domain
MTSPIKDRKTIDTGDETQRNYRYQYGYGVILLAAAARNAKDYRAVWCEQKEDFLCEIDDAHFDAIQVKTQQRENGYWQTNSAALVKSIRRFGEFDTLYPGAIRRFVFVSNAECLDSDADSLAAKSPFHLLRGISLATDCGGLTGKAREAFDQLKSDSNSTEDALFSVLGRLDLTLGPNREGFPAEIAQNHLPGLERCKHLNPRGLASVTEALINFIERASSLSTQSPERHLACLNRSQESDPQLKAKRISVEEFLEECNKAVSVADFLLGDSVTPQEGDTTVLRELCRVLRPDGSIRFAREHDFAGVFTRDELNDFDAFIDLCRNPAFAFQDPALERLRDVLKDAVQHFCVEIGVSTCVMTPGSHRVPPELEAKHPSVFREKVNRITTAAEVLCAAYDGLVRAASRKLGFQGKH